MVFVIRLRLRAQDKRRVHVDPKALRCLKRRLARIVFSTLKTDHNSVGAGAVRSAAEAPSDGDGAAGRGYRISGSGPGGARGGQGVVRRCRRMLPDRQPVYRRGPRGARSVSISPIRTHNAITCAARLSTRRSNAAIRAASEPGSAYGGGSTCTKASTSADRNTAVHRRTDPQSGAAAGRAVGSVSGGAAGIAAR